MQLKRIRGAMLPLFALAILLGSVRLAVPAFAAEPPSGTWLETACNEGDSGPDLPPPPYLKGIIRFSGMTLYLSSRVFDDKDCSHLRPGAVTEIAVPFTFAANVDTTDGSLAIDAVLTDPDDGSTTPMYGLMKVQNRQLLVAFFSTAESRPKALDRSQAQIFAPL
jgi:hypothetical protein